LGKWRPASNPSVNAPARSLQRAKLSDPPTYLGGSQNTKVRAARVDPKRSWSGDYDPTKKIGEINTAIGQFNTELDALIDLCGNVETAQDRFKSYEKLEGELRQTADAGKLNEALDLEKLGRLNNYTQDQIRLLESWTQADYAIPSDVAQLSSERLGNLKLELEPRARWVLILKKTKTSNRSWKNWPIPRTMRPLRF
jgi:hypothetical protein